MPVQAVFMPTGMFAGLQFMLLLLLLFLLPFLFLYLCFSTFSDVTEE